MQNFAKFAGVQDASEHLGDNTAETTSPRHQVDLEAQPTQVTARPARASLPSGQRNSRKSIQSAKSDGSLRNPVITAAADAPPLPENAQHIYDLARAQPDNNAQDTNNDDAPNEEDDAEWGPSHPCFPHLNPYVPVDSADFRNTRILRVERTYTEANDLYPVFKSIYPEVVDSHLSEPEFHSMVRHLNELLKEAFSPATTRAALDAFLGVATGFLWDDFGRTSVKKGVRAIETYMEEWNVQKQREQRDVRLIPLRKTGYMTLDMQIPDPKLDELDADDDDGAPDDESLASTSIMPTIPPVHYGFNARR